MASIMLLLLGYFLYSQYRHEILPTDNITAEADSRVVSKVHSVENNFGRARIIKQDGNKVNIAVDYSYDGVLGKRAIIYSKVRGKGEKYTEYYSGPFYVGQLFAGTGTKEIELIRDRHNKYSYRSDYLTIELSDGAGKEITSEIELTIDWPSEETYQISTISKQEIDKLFQESVTLIDSGKRSHLEKAKRILERLILKHTDYVPAYAEIARYHMMTNWNKQGLLQAERTLQTALKIDPMHANTYVLLGYVYTHQGRYNEALQSFKKAESIGTNNLWLYSNWGEYLLRIGDVENAIVKYMIAVKQPRPFNTYDRAQIDAYSNVLHFLKLKKEWNRADALYSKRMNEFHDNGCYRTEYAYFKLEIFGSYEEAINIATPALDKKCNIKNYTNIVLGLAHYVKWADLVRKGAESEEVINIYNKSQILFSDMVYIIHSLSLSDKTSFAIPYLLKNGVNINAQDSSGNTPISMSVEKGDVPSVDRLIKHGADPNKRIGERGITPLMLAVLKNNKAMVKFLLSSGSDAKAQTPEGITAESLALSLEFVDLAEIIRSHIKI